MKIPEILQGESRTRFLQGVAFGDVATMMIGFMWGGWVTGGTARTMNVPSPSSMRQAHTRETASSANTLRRLPPRAWTIHWPGRAWSASRPNSQRQPRRADRRFAGAGMQPNEQSKVQTAFLSVLLLAGGSPVRLLCASQWPSGGPIRNDGSEPDTRSLRSCLVPCGRHWIARADPASSWATYDFDCGLPG